MDNKKMQGVESGGFLFLDGADAMLADKERKQIEYLEKKLDYHKPEQILSVFQKLVEERTFKTPVGILYLKRMQDYLYNKEYLGKERIPYIPVVMPCNLTAPKPPVELKSVKSVAKKREEIKISNHRISVFMNVILVFALILMFVIALKSETPNMMNYKSALENKYAAWEQELTVRENQLKEKERELKLQD